MTLGELIEALAKLDQTMVFRHGFLRPHSYRGSYELLAFEPAPNVAVALMLDAAKGALGATFEGYKGGEYRMDEHTEVMLAERGGHGEPLSAPWISLNVELALLTAHPALRHPSRVKFHELLDHAMDATPEGESFVGRFVVMLSQLEVETAVTREREALEKRLLAAVKGQPS